MARVRSKLVTERCARVTFDVVGERGGRVERVRFVRSAVDRGRDAIEEEDKRDVCEI